MTFESLWTAETVQQIRNEFSASKHNYLCNGSPTFAELWYEFQEEIRNLAESFSPGSQSLDNDNDLSVLFIHAHLDNKKARLDFLDYCLSLLLNHENK